MGHTVWSQRIVMNIILDELKGFGRSLRQEERLVYEQMLKKAMRHFGSVSYASSFHAWALVLLSIMLEQEKRIIQMEKSYESVADGRVQEQELDCAVDKNL